MSEPVALSRREQQIMDVVYSLGQASVSDVLARLPDPPARVSVRTLMRILEEKGHLKHRRQGKEFIYLPTRPRAQAARSALDRVLGTFFGGSMERALAAHLSRRKEKLSDEEFRRLDDLIRQAREKGR
jgi:predicted transcriptional regulator